MNPYSEEIFNYHLSKAWEKRKHAQTESEQKWWNRIIEMLHADFEGKDALWRAWKQND